MITPLIISIEGNIGCGKTTLIDNLQIYLQKSNINNIRVLREPVEVWEKLTDSSDNESIITKFYKNKKKFAFSFQIFVLKTLFECINQCIETYPDCEVIICERSILSSRHVFTKMLCNDDCINEIEYKIYEGLFDNWVKFMDITPQKFVFLKTLTDTCMSRINKRDRGSECCITNEYIDSCGFHHQLWIDSISQNNVLTINCNNNVIYDINDYDNLGLLWIKEILSFIYK
jgi:deoxyadenosine/deoxycytidine kinase